MPPDRSRHSLSGRLRTPSGSALPRPHTSLRDSRVSTGFTEKAGLERLILMKISQRAMQPSYNLLSGEPVAGRPPSRGNHSVRASSHESSKENMAPPDADGYETQRRAIEELKAELAAMRYQNETVQQEKEMTAAKHTSEIEDQRRQAEEAMQAKRTMEEEVRKKGRQLESAQAELKELRERASDDQARLETKLRNLERANADFTEQVEELSSSKDEAARVGDQKLVELRRELQSAKQTVEQLEQEGNSRETVLHATQAQLVEKDTQIGNLEAEVLRLKAHTGDTETMAVIRSELSDQVTHIRKLESTNRSQLEELKHLRQVHKVVAVVEEEKHSLLLKLEAAQAFEPRLHEAQIQMQRLEDERLAWAAYFKSDGDGADDDMKFDSPEAMARALTEERVNLASYVDKLGTLQADVITLEETVRVLEEEKNKLRDEVKTAKASLTTAREEKAATEHLRQSDATLITTLRAQLNTFEAEAQRFTEHYDEVQATRIRELGELVDQYKEQAQKLQQELSSQASANKRQRSEEPEGASHEQLGQLLRKNRKLQDELSAAQTKLASCEKDLSATKKKLHSARKQNEVRVLSLRSNPTSDHETWKMATIKALEKENAELLAQVQNPQNGSVNTIPASQLDAAQRGVDKAMAEVASVEKSKRRLKEVWVAKSAEFREGIFSTLGWNVTFIPGGKMRMESLFRPSKTEEHENSIIFDGEKGTMKVGGGPRSEFAQRIDNHIKFWVREQKCIPAFMAALTMELYEEKQAAEQKENS